jgi:CBS domain-containing protein
MRVYEIMTKNATCIAPNTTVRDAAGRMRDMDVGSLPVCENDRLVGLVTDRDIAVRSVAVGHDPNAERVRDVMTPGIVYCFDDQDVREAADIMREKQIRRLPVLNRDKRLVGIISLGDVAVEVGEKVAGQALQGISEPSAPKTE